MRAKETPGRRPGESASNVRADTRSLAAGDDLALDLDRVRALAAEIGLIVGRRCRICRRPIWAPKSVARVCGPRCASRLTEDGTR